MDQPNAANQGQSINFDAQALHDADEAEYQREEDERQHELKQLLTCAFDCDLSDEDSLDENTSQNLSQQHDSIAVETGDPQSWQQRANGHVRSQRHQYMMAHASTPISGTAPPLGSPGHPFTPYNQSAHAEDPGQQFAEQVQQFEGHNLLNVEQLRGGAVEGGQTYMQHPEGVLPERGEIEGGNDEDDSIPHSVPTPTRPHHPRAQYPASYQNFGYPRPQVYDGQEASDHERDLYSAQQPEGAPPRGAGLAPHGAFSSKDLDNYKVQFMNQKRLVDTSGVSTVSLESETMTSEAGSTMPRPGSPGEEAQQMQKEFLSPEVTPRGGQYTQLEILYRARGNKIEELITELKQVKDDSGREIRILKHKLTLVEGERDGLSGSLEQSKQLLADTKHREQQLQAKVQGFESQLQALVTQKTELLGKLQDAESHIEALNAQLADLGTSEAIQRSREQHESVVQGLRHKYDSEILTLREELDNAKRIAEQKDEELLTSKKEAMGLIKELETSKVERGEAVNKLTKSLEESQRQCRELLDTGASQEASKLKLQLQETIAGKSIAEDMSSALQEEVKELKEQLTMYESASQFGAVPGLSSAPMDDSYAQLAIKSTTNQSTVPDSARSDDLSSLSADTIHGLKKELERCLAMYKAKREQLGQTSAELADTRASMEELKLRMEKTEKELKETKVKLSLKEMSRSGASSLKEVRLQKEMDKIIAEKETTRLEFETELSKFTEVAASGATSLKEAQLTKQCEQLNSDKQILHLELEELRSRFAEVAHSEETLTELNAELRAQMSAMVKEFDEDKRQAVEKCQETVLQHHEQSKQKLREELEQEMTERKRQLTAEFEEKITTLKEDLKTSQTEMDEVKELYVKVCEEKSAAEAALNSEWEQKLNVELHQLRLELQQEQGAALEELRESLGNEHLVALASAKDTWRQEQQEEFSQKLEKELGQAKEEWLSAHESDKQVALAAAVEDAIQQTEQQLEQQLREHYADEMEHKMQEARLKWQTDKRVGFERDLQERLQAARDTWKNAELPAAIEEAKVTWQKAMLGDFPTMEEKINKTLSEAKKDWRSKEKKHRDQSENKIRELSKLVVDVETKVEKENWDLKQDLNRLRVEKSSIEKEFMEAKEKWTEEKARLLEEKEAEKKGAVRAAVEQAEGDYRLFLEEHQDTLNKALKCARDGHEREKEEMVKNHEDELNSLRSKLENEIANSRKLSEDKDASDVSWQEKIDALCEKHRQEKESLMAQQRDSLHQTLDEARARWQEDAEKLTAEKQEVCAREAALEEENGRYRGELERLESLLQSADAHMEAEIEKLHGELDEAHRAELAHEVQSQVGKVEQELTQKLEGVLTEKSVLNGKLEETRSLLKELESKYKKDTANLAEKARSYKHDLQAARKELEEKWRSEEGLATQRGQLAGRLKELEGHVEKAERQRREAVEAYRKSEAEHAQLVDAYKTRQSELNAQVQHLEQQVAQAEKEARKQYTLLHESLGREHQSTVERLQREIAEIRTNHKSDKEKLKKEYSAEKSKWKRELEAYKNQKKDLMTSSSQTDSSCATIDEATLQEIRARYTRSVTKMKQDVIRHVTKSNELAAETVKIEVLKERQKTARRLRKYYMKCLAQLLDDDRGREEKLKVMEAALDNIPSLATSAASTRTNTPSVGELKTPTPSDFAPIEALSSTLKSHVERQQVPGGPAHMPGPQPFIAQHSERDSRKARNIRGDARAHSEERWTLRSRSEDKRDTDVAYYKDGSDSATPVATPAETPIEELLRQEQVLRQRLAQQTHKMARDHNITQRDSAAGIKNRSEAHIGDYRDSHSSSKRSSGRDSDSYKSKASSHAFERDTDGRLSSGSSKRTSFGTVTEYPRTPNKHPSEPNLYQKYDSRSSSRSRRLFDGIGSSENGLNANRSSSSGARSTEASMLAVQSAPPSPPKSKKSSYKYTSLRTNLHPAYSHLSKAISASSLTDTRHGAHRHVYDFPQSAFDLSDISLKQQSPPERDTASGLTTPTEVEKHPDSGQVGLPSSGGVITKPTPKKAPRAHSESRLPRPVPSLLQSNNNNNCELQSSFSSFEKYSPADSGISTRQPSITLGTQYLLDGKSHSSNASGDGQLTELRLSWESNPPNTFNIHTRYTNK